METLETLKKAGIQGPGAGRNIEEAESPGIIKIGGKGRVLVFSFGSITSGIPLSWRAEERRPGLNLLSDFSKETVLRIRKGIEKVRQDEDIVVASIHWGHNFGYEVSEAERKFARDMVAEAGVDILHGHDSDADESFQSEPRKERGWAPADGDIEQGGEEVRNAG